MHEYDVTLKSVLHRCFAGGVLALWAGISITRWHNAELPEVRTRRADLLGEDSARRLIHIELQSRNDDDMALRMAEYALAIYRKFRKWPIQIVLYVGNERLRMRRTLGGPGWTYRFRIADIREVDSAVLLRSNNLDDNILAILAGGNDRRKITRMILRRIDRSRGAVRERALAELLKLAGLRGSAGIIIKEETERMPILDDIMDHPVIGPERRKAMKLGMEKGLEKGLQRGRQEGRTEGERQTLIRLATKRFGKLPVWARERLDSAGKKKLDRLSIRLLTASSLEELLGS